MFCLHIRCRIAAGKMNELREIALALMEETRRAPCCLSYEIGVEESGVAAWIERWESEEDLERHKSAEYFLRAEQAMDGLICGPVLVQRLEPFIK